MKINVINLINMFFGKTAKKRFKRIIILIAVVGAIALFLFTCSFSYDKKNGFQIGSDPIETEIKINKGS